MSSLLASLLLSPVTAPPPPKKRRKDRNWAQYLQETEDRYLRLIPTDRWITVKEIRAALHFKGMAHPRPIMVRLLEKGLIEESKGKWDCYLYRRKVTQ